MKLFSKIALFAFAVVLVFSGCSKGKSVSFAKPYPLPPDLPVDIDNIVIDQYPLHIYWSQTLSERGYAQDRQGRYNPPPEFEHFLTAFGDTIFRYTPNYYILQTRGAYVNWQPITERDFAGTMNPTRAGFYNALGYGALENDIGPLMMLYDGKLVKAEDLTIVVTDLEEQGLNNVKLAASVRNILADKYSSAAAVIAIQLPFNGTNYKPNPDSRGQMITQTIAGYKPLYLIVTGLSDPVAIFIKAFKVNAERNNVNCYIVSTIYPPEIENIRVSDIIVPQSASAADQSRVDRDRRRLDELWNSRNTNAPERIWNLRDVTKSNMFENFGVTDPLNLRIFEYSAIRGSAKNGRRLWQLNIEFEKPENLDLKDMAAVIENYRYLKQDSAADTEPASDGRRARRTAGSNNPAGVWESNNAIMQRDMEISATPESVPNTNRALVYITPRDKRRPSQQSSVLYFEIVLRMPVYVPKWVEDFNDVTGTTAGKTRGFYTFVEGILGLNPGERTRAVDGHEILRYPVIITKIPARAQ